jgi:hypothetical protein
MAVLTADFEAGTNGATIATADTGSANAWDAVLTVTGGTRTYSTTQAAHGTKSGSFATSTTVGGSAVVWTTSLTGSAAAGPFYSRAYLYMTSNSVQPVPLAFMSSTTSNRVGLRITVAGKIAVIINGTTTNETSTSVIPLNTWVRLELAATGSATVGAYEMRYYASADSATATETLNASGATNLNTGGTIDRVAFGLTQAIASAPTLYIDDAGASTVGFMGPSVVAGNVLTAAGFFGS